MKEILDSIKSFRNNLLGIIVLPFAMIFVIVGMILLQVKAVLGER